MKDTRDRVLAVHVIMGKESNAEISQHIAELISLINTDGGNVVETIVQRIRAPRSSTLFGPGQIQTINEAAKRCNADVVVLNTELSPQQQRNIETMMDKRIIDRTRLIIDIFAKHAHSREGKLEVEEALLRYMLPRLTGKGIVMSQTGGGVGTRGPGETKLEMDRRKIKDRLKKIKQLMEAVRTQRLTQQSKRIKFDIPVVSLVGYTSAGKSTLLNTLTKSFVKTDEELFTTLDPISRRLYFENGVYAIITDTVGFIDRLPIQLIKAFRTTLEDVSNADLLLLVIDISKPDYENDIKIVMDVLEEISTDKKPIIYVFNKIDKLDPAVSLRNLTNKYEKSICVSAINGTGIEALKSMILSELTLLKHTDVSEGTYELYRVV
ncbi:MAG: GTPase HflX [bacterium]